MVQINSRRLRLAVSDVISNDVRQQRDSEIIPGLQHVRDNINNNRLISIIWIVLITGGFVITLYQTYDRISYFYTYPIALDYLFIEGWDENLNPEIVLCSGDNEKFATLRKKYDVERRREIQDRYCLGDLLEITKNVNITVREFMKYLYCAKDTIVEVQSKMLNGTIKNIEVNQLDEVFTPFGYCTMINLRSFAKNDVNQVLRVKFKKAPGSCAQSRIIIFIQNADHPPSVNQVMSFGTGIKLTGVLDQKIYLFEPLTSNPCSTTADYFECYDNCVLRMLYDNPNVTCRLPFSPAMKLKYHECTYANRPESVASLRNTMRVLSRTKATTDCKCPRLCMQLTASFTTVMDVIEEDTTILVIKSTGYAMRMKERRAYDAITLFCDIGGNMGLFLGFSALTIVEAILAGTKYFKNFVCKTRTNNASRQLILGKITLQYLKVKADRLKSKSLAASNFIRKLFPNENSNVVIYVKIFARILCFAMFCYLVKNRIDYYLTNPSRPVVNIILNSTVLFPDITICGTNNDILDFMEVIQKMEQTKFGHYCDVTLLDFIDYEKAEDVWRYSNLTGNFVKKEELNVEEFYSIPIITNNDADNVSMPEGLCRRFRPGEQVFTGITTLFTIIGLFSQDCTKVQNMYVSYHGLDVDLRDRLLLPLGAQTMTSLHVRRVIRLNKSNRQCEDFDKTTACKKSCLLAKLRATVPCWLPYMPEINITTCKNALAAKEADQIYKTVYLTLKPYTDQCGCVIPCIENYVTPYITSEPQKGVQVIGINLFNFFNAMFEIYEEAEDYPFVKLLCDVGGMLGAALGLSVLSIADFAQTVVVSSLKRKRNE